MFESLKRTFKVFRGIPLTPEDHGLLWARTAGVVELCQNSHPSINFSMPEERICATQVAQGLWDIRAERKTSAPPFAAPLTLSFGYEAAGLPIAQKVPTEKMVRILLANDPHRVALPDHISIICK